MVEPETSLQEQARHPEPLLKNLLFPQQPLALIDRENGQPISLEAVLWDHYYRYYRLAAQDALHRSRRKPFQLGGLAGYDQLVGILKHLEQDNLLHQDASFFKELKSRLQQAIKVTRDQAEDIRQAQTFLQQVEHFLAHTPRPTLVVPQKPSPETSACYKVGDIATAKVGQQWQFTFRPIRAVHFHNGQFWYLFEGFETGYCETDVVLASQVGSQAEGLLWDGQAADSFCQVASLGQTGTPPIPEGSVLIAFSKPNASLTEAEILPPFFSQSGNVNSILVEPQPFCWISETISAELCAATTVHTPGGLLFWIQQQLEQKFKQFAQQPQLGPTCQRLNRKWQRVAQIWLPGILFCYIIASLPRNNLELEAFYGILRDNQRRVSGRKDTSPLRLFGAGEAMVLMIQTEAELLEWCQTVAQDKETYRTQRRLQEESEERQRWLWRLHRDPVKAMTQVDEQFYAVLQELGLTSGMKQPDT